MTSVRRPQHARHDERGVDRERDDTEYDRIATDATTLLLFRGLVAHRVDAAHLMTGASSNVWYGAGDGTVHSRPCVRASSQTRAVAGAPLRTHFQIT